MNYAKAIRTIRAAKGLDQKDLALCLGVDKSYLSLLESGKRKPSVDFLENFYKKIKIPPHLFLLLSYEKDDLSNISSLETNKLATELVEILSGLEKKVDGK
jgi:transcriptional regulator with XRE-family HTH domain